MFFFFAATVTLFHCSSTGSLAIDVGGLILDSPFSSLWRLAEHLIQNSKIKLPESLAGAIASKALPIMQKAIMK